jgi:hypothetical protein
MDKAALDTLELWATNETTFESLLKQARHAVEEHTIEFAAQKLVDFYVEKAVPVLLAAEAIHKLVTTREELADLSTELGEEEALTGLFAEPLKLSTAGLGGVDAGEFDKRFLEAIVGTEGLFRRYGLKSDALRKIRAIHHEDVTVRVLEVSYCKEHLVCGPGESTPGIEPFLYFDFRAVVPRTEPGGARTVFTDQLVLPYDAFFFDLLQFNGQGPPRS